MKLCQRRQEVLVNLNNRGTTLVEITIGFLMLAIILTSFIKILKLSTEMTEDAVKTKDKNLLFEEKYYAGYNYIVDFNGSQNYAFREDGNSILPMTIELKPLKSDKFFVNGAINNNNNEIGEAIVLSNTKLKIIENYRDMEIARKSIFRYVYNK